MTLQLEREGNVMNYATLMQKVRDRCYTYSWSSYDTCQ